jgi:hypothetical protein
MLTRDLGGGRTEIVTLSFWESRAAITGFAGEDIARGRLLQGGRPLPGRARGDRHPLRGVRTRLIAPTSPVDHRQLAAAVGASTHHLPMVNSARVNHG